MKRFARLTLAVSLLLAAPVPAQQAQPQESAEPEIPRILETIDVRVINIDVVVTDRKGNVIPGLTRDDFVLYENGRPQRITNFYEIVTREAEAEAEVRTGPEEQPQAPEQPEQLRRKIIIFIDNLSLAPFNRNRVFASMKEFVREVLRPGDQAMVVTWNRSMKVRLPFTSDAVQIEQTLDAISGESALGIHAISERRQVQGQIRDAQRFQDAIMAARSYAQSIEHDLRQTVSSINSLMSTLGGVEGKKIMLVTSEGFPLQPGREMFYFIDDIARERANWQGGGSIFLESMHFNAASRIESIAHSANANGITLYTLHAGGLVGLSESSAENAQPVSPAVQHAGLSNSTDSLRLMADMTGGLAVVGTNNFKGAFERIRQDLSSYYSLGYRSGTERVDRQRSIEVKSTRPGLVVRSRRSFVEKSIDSEVTDKVIANLFYEGSANDLGIVARTGRPQRQNDGLFRVPLEVLIPMENLTILPRGEEYGGSFTLYIVVSNKDGDMSDVQRQQHSLRVPKDEIDHIKGRHYTYAVDLIMEPGRGRISVGVLDDVTSGSGYRVAELMVRDLR
ncbi:MAG TPA: VWA domain-containing protein [Thermoanaerobaculia bacterium]|nr:VWA domain-containing protein [Thermoanaerobaculia bacterium]